MTDKYITVSNIKDALHNSIGILLKRRMNDYVWNDMIPQRVTHGGESGKRKKKKKTPKFQTTTKFDTLLRTPEPQRQRSSLIALYTNT